MVGGLLCGLPVSPFDSYALSGWRSGFRTRPGAATCRPFSFRWFPPHRPPLWPRPPAMCWAGCFAPARPTLFTPPSWPWRKVRCRRDCRGPLCHSCHRVSTSPFHPRDWPHLCHLLPAQVHSTTESLFAALSARWLLAARRPATARMVTMYTWTRCCAAPGPNSSFQTDWCLKR